MLFQLGEHSTIIESLLTLLDPFAGNDQCASCVSPFKSEVTAEKWGSYVEAAIERIKTEIPRTVVNLLGVFEVSQVYTITEGQAYCHPLLNISQAIINRVECSCFLGSDQDRKNMDALVGCELHYLHGLIITSKY